MVMIQVSVALRSIRAVVCVSRDSGDLNALSLFFSGNIESGSEESPEAGPQRPTSAGRLDRWIVVICQQFSRRFKLIACGACCYVVTKNGVHNKSRGEYPTQYVPSPVFWSADGDESHSCKREEPGRKSGRDQFKYVMSKPRLMPAQRIST